MSTSPGLRRARRREFLRLRLCGFETRSLRTLSIEKPLPLNSWSSLQVGEIGS